MVPFPHDTVGNAWRHPWKRPVAFDPERRKSKPVTQLATQAPSHYPRPQRTNDSTLIVRYFNAYDLILIAPSRVGKSRDVIIPAFLDWPSGVDVEQLMEQLKVETDGADFADEDEDQLPKGGGA